MSSALTQVHPPQQLAQLNTYGVRELTAAEAMATNGGIAPLVMAIAAIVGADAALLAAGAAVLTYLSSRADKE